MTMRNKLIVIVLVLVLLPLLVPHNGFTLASNLQDFQYRLINNDTAVEITGYTGKGGSIAIPAQIGGRPVTALASRAFVQKDITAVAIPDSVTIIGSWAFRDNELSSVTIPPGLTSLEYGVFAYNQLISASIPNSVKVIGASAFYMNKLASLTIPDSVTSIGSNAFASNNLTSLSIPSSVTSIGSHAFAWNHLTSVNIPPSLTKIEWCTFGYNQLTSVTIPDSVTDLWGFEGNQLSTVVIPESVRNIGKYAFSDNLLTSVTIPSSVTSIDENAFSANKLTSIIIPITVTSIGEDAFTGNSDDFTLLGEKGSEAENYAKSKELPFADPASTQQPSTPSETPPPSTPDIPIKDPSGNLRVFLNGEQVAFPDQKPQIVGGRTLVPVRFISEALGAGVTWEDATQQVKITQGQKHIVLTIGRAEVLVDGTTFILDVPAQIIAGRTMVPLRFVSEVLGASVEWSEEYYAVFITSRT